MRNEQLAMLPILEKKTRWIKHLDTYPHLKPPFCVHVT